MTTLRPRKVWQHDTENVSEDQIREYFHRLGWEVDRFVKDYGEDLFVRIFEGGVFTGKSFYVQLKGTNNTQQYALKTGVFSYGVDAVNLLQWHRNQFPVIFVLWDIEQRVGYWLHIQSYVDIRLKKDPLWLKQEEGERNIHIASDQMLPWSEDKSLLILINKEYQKVSLGRQLLEQMQYFEIETAARRLTAALQLEENPSEYLSLKATLTEEEQRPAPISSEIEMNSDPDNAERWIELASQHYTQHNFEKAMAAINKAKHLGASGVQYAMIHGSILTEYAIAQGGRRKSLLYEAIALFETASSELQYPEKIVTDYNIGNALSALGSYTEAIQRYDTALAAEPHTRLAAQIWKNRGTAYYHLGNHAEEFASYQKALALNPNLWEAYTSWAVTETHLENYTHAKDLYISALKVYPELGERYPQQIYGLALVYWKLEELVLSYQYVNQVLSVKPDDESSLYLKRQLLSSLWRKDYHYITDALTLFRMWLQDDPTDIFIRRELYLLYRAQADQQQASALLSETTSVVSTSPESLYYYACMLIDEGRVSEAIDALERAFQQNQEHVIVHKLAQLKEKIGDYREAIRLYKLLFADNELHLLRSIAHCYNNLNEHEVCVWCCTRAIQLDLLKESWWNNLVYSLMSLDKVLCAIAVERLHTDLMKVLNEEAPRPSSSEFSLLLLGAIKAEFGEPFVESILAPSPPF